MADRLTIENRTFLDQDIHSTSFGCGDYEICLFQGCNFSEVRLRDFRFIDCVFAECNFSNAKIQNLTLNSVQFKNCKLLGMNFETCNNLLFEASFVGCSLDYSTFLEMNIKGTRFERSSLIDVDFTNAGLEGAVFADCDLRGTIFNATNLEKADFTTARNYALDPDRNRLKKAKFSLPAVLGLLAKYRIVIE